MVFGLSAKEDKRKDGLTSIAIQPENWCWKEVGFRKDSSTLVGQTKVSGQVSHKEESCLRFTSKSSGPRSSDSSNHLHAVTLFQVQLHSRDNRPVACSPPMFACVFHSATANFPSCVASFGDCVVCAA